MAFHTLLGEGMVRSSFNIEVGMGTHWSKCIWYVFRRDRVLACLFPLSPLSTERVPKQRWRHFTTILGGKWFVAPSMLKWEWTSAEANASNRPIDEIGCWRVPSHFRIWVPRGYGSSGDGHCSFLKATPRESKRRRRGEVDRTCHLPENLVILEIK